MATPFRKRPDQYPDPVILTETANGVLDQFGHFYPFRVSDSTIAAKTNVRYYVKSVCLSGEINGIKAVCASQITATFNGQLIYLLQLKYPAMTLVTDYFAVFGERFPGILCDRDKAITASSTASSYSASIIYAEIDDLNQNHPPAGGA